jgi:hypothetical protein
VLSWWLKLIVTWHLLEIGGTITKKDLLCSNRRVNLTLMVVDSLSEMGHGTMTDDFFSLYFSYLCEVDFCFCYLLCSYFSSITLLVLSIFAQKIDTCVIMEFWKDRLLNY